MRTNKVLGQVVDSESLDHNQTGAHHSKQQLHVSETSHQQAWYSNPVPTVYDDDQVGGHVDQSPRHANHVHVVKVEFYVPCNRG